MMINFSIQILYMLQNKRYDGNLIKGGKMNYLIGFIIFAGGLSILALLGLLFIYRELKKVVEGLQIWLLKVMKNE